MVPLGSRGYQFNKAEVKAFDRVEFGYACDNNTASVFSIFTPIQGTAINNRVGTRVLLKSIYIRGYVMWNNFLNATVPPWTGQMYSNPGIIRLSVVLDCQPNGGTAAITDIFDSTTPASQLNINYRDRFKVLKQKIWSFDPCVYDDVNDRYAGYTNQCKVVKVYKKCNIPVFFNAGNTGTASDVSSNNIIMVWQSSLGINVDIASQAQVSIRCRFIDP